MHPGLGEVAGDVEPDPGAVFEAHDADSVDELVAGGGASEPEPAGDSGVDRLFEGGLDRPERTADSEQPSHADRTSRPGRAPDTERDRGTGRAHESAREEPHDTTATDVLAELEAAVGGDGAAPSAEPEDLDAIDDGDVEDALAAAEAIDDADGAESVPAEWQDR